MTDINQPTATLVCEFMVLMSRSSGTLPTLSTVFFTDALTLQVSGTQYSLPVAFGSFFALNHHRRWTIDHRSQRTRVHAQARVCVRCCPLVSSSALSLALRWLYFHCYLIFCIEKSNLADSTHAYPLSSSNDLHQSRFPRAGHKQAHKPSSTSQAAQAAQCAIAS